MKTGSVQIIAKDWHINQIKAAMQHRKTAQAKFELGLISFTEYNREQKIAAAVEETVAADKMRMLQCLTS
jgi:outer membrane protein TolC